MEVPLFGSFRGSGNARRRAWMFTLLYWAWFGSSAKIQLVCGLYWVKRSLEAHKNKKYFQTSACVDDRNPAWL